MGAERFPDVCIVIGIDPSFPTLVLANAGMAFLKIRELRDSDAIVTSLLTRIKCNRYVSKAAIRHQCCSWK